MTVAYLFLVILIFLTFVVSVNKVLNIMLPADLQSCSYYVPEHLRNFVSFGVLINMGNSTRKIRK
jgi:hypothetical protein